MEIIEINDSESWKKIKDCVFGNALLYITNGNKKEFDFIIDFLSEKYPNYFSKLFLVHHSVMWFSDEEDVGKQFVYFEPSVGESEAYHALYYLELEFDKMKINGNFR